ncbi:hypothetical protein PRIPAC_97311 [Pristionchus pacificus]|uniref:Uncharacterized protein n=1 Tax=Pristionchus pacificus TaxID=54126 RepID=A0A454XLA3_PRIPA|nr:hypothetical protein PRIPAC_97311 [Pristionchus pacificus]|eukprot:PDM81614.1 hypothetical protein PRIPAC_30595 [Pristionchus pacificus]
MSAQSKNSGSSCKTQQTASSVSTTQKDDYNIGRNQDGSYNTKLINVRVVAGEVLVTVKWEVSGETEDIPARYYGMDNHENKRALTEFVFRSIVKNPEVEFAKPVEEYYKSCALNIDKMRAGQRLQQQKTLQQLQQKQQAQKAQKAHKGPGIAPAIAPTKRLDTDKATRTTTRSKPAQKLKSPSKQKQVTPKQAKAPTQAKSQAPGTSGNVRPAASNSSKKFKRALALAKKKDEASSKKHKKATREKRK